MEITYSYSISPPRQPNYTAIAPAFMSAIMFWNHAETTMKQIVQLILGQSPVSMAVTAEMGDRSLVQAVMTASRETDLSELSPHLKHFCKGFERLLGYRNFYVHGIYSTELDGAETVIRIFTFDGKNQLRMFNPTLSRADFDTYTRNVHKLIGYGAAIQKELGAEGDGLEKMITSYRASLEMPDWLPELEKVPQYLQAQVPPPPSFRG